MKNFKKVLALVLAVVMLLSFATVASAASSASYKDVEDIDNVEAVDVLSAIGILDGFDDKTFKPDNILTRAQAAKIIAMFDNGSTDINKIYASANPFTDCVGNWAESFIAYCYKTGIIDGVGNLKFAPNNKLTGVQFMKMALVVLGYDAKAEGLTGKNWDVNTLALAKRVGLTAGFPKNYDFKSEMSRQEAAQVMLNALRADVVEYGSKLAWNSNITTWPANANGKVYWSVTGAVSTGEKLGKTWKLEEGYAEDAFYRPIRTWELNGKVIGTYLFDVQAEYTTEATLCDILVDTGIAKTDYNTPRSFYHAINGNNSFSDITAQHDKIDAWNKTCSSTAQTVGHQGTLTQVFYVTTDESAGGAGGAGWRIIEIDTWLGNVNKVSKTTTNKGGHTVTDYLATIDVFQNDDNQHNWNCLTDVVTTDAAGLAKNDFVLFNYSYRDKFEGTYNVETVTGKTVDFDGFKEINYPSQTKLDGEFIPDAWHFHAGYSMSKTAAEFGEKVAFFDNYGNVIGLFDTEAAALNYLVIDKMWVEYNKGDASIHANVVGLDAKVINDVTIATLTNYLGSKDDADSLAAATGLVASDFEWSKHPMIKVWYNNLTLTDAKYNVVDATYTYNLADSDYAIFVRDNVTFTEGSAIVKVGDEGVFAVDNDTQFLINEGKGVYTAVTGADNLGSLKADHAEVVMDGNGMATVVYLYGNIIRVDESFVAYLSNNPKVWRDGDYYYFNVWKDGKLVTLYTDDATNLNIGASGFYKFTFKAVGDKTIVHVSELLTDEQHTRVWAVTDYGNGTLNIAYDTAKTWVKLTSDVVVYSIAVDTSVAAHDFDYDYIVGHGCYLMFNAAGQVTEIYVVETELDP